MTDTYIVGVDGTAQASRAVDYAADRAKKSGASVHLVHILEWSPYSFHTPEELAERHGRREQEIARAQAMVEPIAAGLKKKGIDVSVEVRHGNAGDLLCSIAGEHKGSQIVIGRTGDSALAQRLLGGLAMTLVQAAPVPVTIVP
jgi:nucleotide-binding universal stress UspA family protein